MPYRTYKKQRSTRQSRLYNQMSRTRKKLQSNPYQYNHLMKYVERPLGKPTSLAFRSTCSARQSQVCGYQHTESQKPKYDLSYFLTRMPGLDSQANGQRTSSTIFLKGIKLHYDFENLGSIPLRLHIAYIQNKTNCEELSGGNPDTKLFLEKEFFRDTRRNSPTRTLDFDTPPSDQDFVYPYQHYPINNDKWNVLHHSRHLLDPSLKADTVTGAGNETIQGNRPHTESKQHLTLDKYLKFNMPISFDGVGDNNERQFVLVYWITPWNENDNPQVAGNVLSARGYDNVYYSDKN